MAKHTQTIRQRIYTYVWPFRGIGTQRVNDQKWKELRLLFNILLVLRNLEEKN